MQRFPIIISVFSKHVWQSKTIFTHPYKTREEEVFAKNGLTLENFAVLT